MNHIATGALTVEAALKQLWVKLNNGLLPFDHSKTKDSNPDVRHEMRLEIQNTVPCKPPSLGFISRYRNRLVGCPRLV